VRPTQSDPDSVAASPFAQVTAHSALIRCCHTAHRTYKKIAHSRILVTDIHPYADGHPPIGGRFRPIRHAPNHHCHVLYGPPSLPPSTLDIGGHEWTPRFRRIRWSWRRSRFARQADIDTILASAADRGRLLGHFMIDIW